VRTIPNSDWFGAIIKLQENVSPDSFLEKMTTDTTRLKNGDYNRSIRLCKVSDAYFELSKMDGYLFKTRDKNTLVIGFSIAIVVLVISLFNYLNITLIRAPKRLKNLAGQRIMGASKKEIAGQVIAETSLHILVAFGIALLFMPDAMRLFNSFMGSDLLWLDIVQWNNLPYILVLLSILILIPAIYLIAKFNIKNPMEVFKNPAGKKIQYLGSLVIFQMIISVALIAFSINIKHQMNFILRIVPQADQIICITDYSEDLSQDFIDHVRQSATTTEYLLGEITGGKSYTNDKGETYLFNTTKPNYFDFLRIPVLMGRTFDSIPSEIVQVVANKAYIRSKGIEGDPIGYQFSIFENDKVYRIVGVCEDFITENVAVDVQPTLYMLYDGTNGEWSINIRFRGSLEDKINEIKELLVKYSEVEDDKEYETALSAEIYTMADYYLNLNPEVKRLRSMVEFFALISIFLSAMGLFGLSWYTVERRHKEMALRKVHGASTGKLLLLLCKTFFIWCAVATLIALPIGYYISKYWLDGFVYRIHNSLWTMILTALIAAAVTFCTVIYQTARAATANPAKYIKME
jgi:ABC-type antimicrobial peptide transport system permease subunit